MPANGQDTAEERLTKLALIGTFLGLFGVFATREQSERKEIRLDATDLALLGLAVYRGGRLVAYDQVTEPLRAPFTVTKKDEYGAGEMVVERGQGARKVLGQLISCPTCAGTWIAAALVYGLRIAPRTTRLFMTIVGGTGLAELINNAAEALEWGGRAQRKESAPE